MCAQAHAYTIETPVTDGCHEKVTADAFRAARAALPGIIVPLPSSGDDGALLDDTPFSIPSDLHEIGAVTLLLGVRDNDVKSFAATALDQLAPVNADPASQKQHCLRLAEQDEPTGSAAAVADCHAFIRETLLSALDGLDSSGHPDPTKREDLDVTLAIRGEVHVSVPMFYLRAGRGLHTIEDSFTHTFRSQADPTRITVVLNWVEYVDKSLDEGRDGPAHMTELDRCDDPDDLRKQRRLLAIQAGASALEVLLDSTLDREAKGRGIDAVLDKYLAYDTGNQCSLANHWCDAPENAYANSGCACATAGLAADTHGGSWLAALGLGALMLSRRRRRPGSARARAFGSSKLLTGALSIGFALSAHVAHAETEGKPANVTPGTGGPINALEGKSNSGAPGTRDPAGAFFGRLAFGASYDKPGFAGGVGVRYQLSRPFMLGFDAELNPWIAQTPTRVRTGSFNSYVSIIRRFQLKTDSLNVRSQLGVGVSVLLIDLVGAPSGSYGPFLGVSFLGAEWKIHRGYYLTIDPTYIAYPIPHVTGAPFAYLQYRFQLGLEFGG